MAGVDNFTQCFQCIRIRLVNCREIYLLNNLNLYDLWTTREKRFES